MRYIEPIKALCPGREWTRDMSILEFFGRKPKPETAEQKREREFIKAANGLKTLRVTDRGGMSIDPEEIRDQIIKAREEYKGLVANQ